MQRGGSHQNLTITAPVLPVFSVRASVLRGKTEASTEETLGKLLLTTGTKHERTGARTLGKLPRTLSFQFSQLEKWEIGSKYVR